MKKIDPYTWDYIGLMVVLIIIVIGSILQPGYSGVPASPSGACSESSPETGSGFSTTPPNAPSHNLNDGL